MKKNEFEITALHCVCESSNPSVDIINCLIEVGGRKLLMVSLLYYMYTYVRKLSSSRSHHEFIKNACMIHFVIFQWLMSLFIF